MSLLVSNIRLPFEQPEEEAFEQARRLTSLHDENVQTSVYRVSIDARHGSIFRVYTIRIDAPVELETAIKQRNLSGVRALSTETLPIPRGNKKLLRRPIVVGLGPAGLFAAYFLSVNGYEPLILERGGTLEERDEAVTDFWSNGIFHPDCNIQFGEGGAGAYSDGKLTTRIHDPLCTAVLEILAAHGAPADILKQAKPHVGTDILKTVVRRMRQTIERHDGTVQFHTALTGVSIQNGALCAVLTNQAEFPCQRAIIAIGHSARNTFHALYKNGISFEPKAFSIGVRIEHLQSALDAALYGKYAGHPSLPPADYRLSYRTKDRACYSFCMCPGGMVVAAQSEPETIVTNGMSYHARDGKNANAALVVSVSPTDFADGAPFGGIALQRQIEQAAFQQTRSYRAPCQSVGDFLGTGRSKNTLSPTYPLGVTYGDAVACFPKFIRRTLQESLPYFGKKIRGFDTPDALLTAPETRTSSPVRIPRGTDYFSPDCAGLIPCGEGAGYAGGILSAAVDGIHAAFRIMGEFAPYG